MILSSSNRTFASRYPGHLKEPKKKKWSLAIGTGSHLFWYGWRPIFITRQVSGLDKAGPDTKHSLRLVTIGRSQKLFHDIMEQAEEMALEEKGIKLFKYDSQSHYWKLDNIINKRDKNTLVTHGDLTSDIIADAEEFLQSREWYERRGVPYRRGYLFYGKPGCGKTSMVQILAAHFERRVYSLSLASIKSDEQLQDAISDVGEDAILLLEDVDAAMGTANIINRTSSDTDDVKESSNGGGFRPLSLASLLNSIDGLNAGEGRILIMTTNHPEKLDPALVRSGRVDEKYEFPLAGIEEIKRLFELFFDDEVLDETDPQLSKLQLSPADVQGIFIRNKKSAENALKELREKAIAAIQT